MEELIREYQNTITALHKRRMDLQARLKGLRGEEYFNVVKRIQCLYSEQMDCEYALREMVK